MWLGEVFAELGHQAAPALHCRQALAIARRFEMPITTLVLNPELPGAARVVKLLTGTNPGVRVVLIRDAAAHPGPALAKGRVRANPDGIPAHCILERPAPWETISRPEWLAKVREMIKLLHG
jgi:hypothetical protein